MVEQSAHAMSGAPPASRAPSGPDAILIGPMAAGKTVVGKRLAHLLGVGFTDLDQEVTRRTGSTIPEIFEVGGEQGFRELEAEVLADLLAGGRGVVSLGGGAPTHAPNRELLRERPTVLIEIDEAAAGRRLRGGKGRPMLAGPDPLARWREIRDARLPVYREIARHRVDGSTASPDGVARAIIRLLEAAEHCEETS